VRANPASVWRSQLRVSSSCIRRTPNRSLHATALQATLAAHLQRSGSRRFFSVDAAGSPCHRGTPRHRGRDLPRSCLVSVSAFKSHMKASAACCRVNVCLDHTSGTFTRLRTRPGLVQPNDPATAVAWRWTLSCVRRSRFHGAQSRSQFLSSRGNLADV